MKHTDIKPILIALILGLVIGASATAFFMKPKPLSATAQWCISNPKYADWAKQRHEKVLKAAEEVYLEK